MNAISSKSAFAFTASIALCFVMSAVAGENLGNGIHWRTSVEVAIGEAHRGRWRMNDSDYRWVDDPTVALDAKGNAYVAWVDQADQDVLLQVFDADNQPKFHEPVNVSRSDDTFSWLPRIAIDRNNHVHVLWQEIIFSGGSHGGEVLLASSRDGGRSFSEPLNLSETTAGAGKGRLTRDHWHNGSLDVVDEAGTRHAAWTEYEGRLLYARSTDSGMRFDEPVLIAGDDTRPARAPTLAASQGTVYLAWTVGEDVSADIRFSRSLDGGNTFSKPDVIAERDGHSDAPRLAVDAQGALHLVFSESPRGIYHRYRIRYTASQDDGANFLRTRDISGQHAEEFASVNFPQLAVHGERVVVGWELFPDHRDRPRGMGLRVSDDGGRTFGDLLMLPDSDEPLGHNGGLQGLLMRKLAVNENEIIVVNSYFKENETSRVRLYRGRFVD